MLNILFVIFSSSAEAVVLIGRTDASRVSIVTVKIADEFLLPEEERHLYSKPVE
jgi:hypothetical protein